MEATQQPLIKSFPCLSKNLEDRGRQIEQRSTLDKGVVQLKFKGNQKQFELNAKLNAIFESIEIESESNEPIFSQIKNFPKKASNVFRAVHSGGAGGAVGPSRKTKFFFFLT